MNCHNYDGSGPDCPSDRNDDGTCTGFKVLMYGHARQIVIDCEASQVEAEEGT
jgi:hypothetical protein